MKIEKINQNQTNFEAIKSVKYKGIYNELPNKKGALTAQKNNPKAMKFFEKYDIRTISFLFNNIHETDSYIIAGTRGWYLEADAMKTVTPADFEKIIARETGRLKTSLSAAAIRKQESPEKEIIVFLHFPPFWNEKRTPGIYDLLKEYKVTRVYFGHIHGNYAIPMNYTYDGISFHLISADYLDFLPKIV